MVKRRSPVEGKGTFFPWFTSFGDTWIHGYIPNGWGWWNFPPFLRRFGLGIHPFGSILAGFSEPSNCGKNFAPTTSTCTPSTSTGGSIYIGRSRINNYTPEVSIFFQNRLPKAPLQLQHAISLQTYGRFGSNIEWRLWQKVHPIAASHGTGYMYLGLVDFLNGKCR